VNDMEHVAIHEAGHAVVAHALGATVQKIDLNAVVDEEGDWGGAETTFEGLGRKHIDFSYSDELEWWSYYFDYLTVSVAGHVADIIHCRTHVPWDDWVKFLLGSEEEGIPNLVHNLEEDEDGTEVVTHAVVVAKGIIEGCWVLVEKLADELMKASALDESGIQKILN
jgi:hypothetical protein